MCGRIIQTMTPQVAAEFFGVEGGGLPNAEPRYNGAPTQQFMILRWNPEGAKRQLDMMRWGLRPRWWNADKKPRMPEPMNAMCETLREKASFRDAFKSRRCIVPVNGFFEWWSKTTPKQPYAIAMKDERPFGMAGLWENWQDPVSKEWLRTFTIITCPPNPLMTRIHDRMPVILNPADYPKWLGETPATPDELQALLRPYPDAGMTMWPVTTRMNSARYQEPDAIDPIDDDPMNAN